MKDLKAFGKVYVVQVGGVVVFAGLDKAKAFDIAATYDYVGSPASSDRVEIFDAQSGEFRGIAYQGGAEFICAEWVVCDRGVKRVQAEPEGVPSQPMGVVDKLRGFFGM